jgi:Tol biopolymer transport system component
VPLQKRKFVRAVATAAVALALGGSTWFLVTHHGANPSAAWKQFPAEALWGGTRDEARSPDGRRIAYLNVGDLLVRPAEGGRPMRLTVDGKPKSWPAWSPDGRAIAFYREEEMFIIPAGGGGERKVGWTLHPEGLAWSGDGKALYFPDKGDAEEPASLYRRSHLTGEKRRLTAPPDAITGDQFPSPSPNGEWMAFARAGLDGGADVYVMPLYDDIARAAPARRLTFQNRPISSVQWTGDGQRIVYRIRDELWAIPESGGRPEKMR